MLVQPVVMPVSGRESWTLPGDDGEVVAPAGRYLAYLAAIERSPDTVRAYAVSNTRLRAENRSLRDQLARHLGLQRTQHDQHTSAEPQ